MDINLFLEGVVKNKIRILTIISIFVLIGLVYILFTPKSYIAETLLLPESKSSSTLSGLGQLASSIPGLGSFGLSSPATDAIRPEFYPSNVKSTTFVLNFIYYTI